MSARCGFRSRTVPPPAPYAAVNAALHPRPYESFRYMIVARLKPNESRTKRAAARLDAASLGQTRKSQGLSPVREMLVEVGETAASARRPPPSSSAKMG